MPQDDENADRPVPDTTAERDPKALLDHIREISQNARTTWFGLLGLLAFVGVALMGHRDADFFAAGAETPLPLIGIAVPVKSFFYVAPALVAALYAYLHLYLMMLWDALADAPARIDGQPLADRVFPWLISHGALWYRNRCRAGPNGQPEGSAAPRALGWAVVGISLIFGWFSGPVILAGLWLRSLPAHDEWLTLWIALCVWLAAMIGWTGLRAARSRMAERPREDVARAPKGQRRGGAVLAALLAFASWETTEGSGAIKYRVTRSDGAVEWRLPLYPANLREVVLTAKPDDWQPHRRWLKAFESAYRAENAIDPNAELSPPQHRAFWAEAKAKWADRLKPVSGRALRDHDLRNADMFRVVLTGADLRGARLDGANLHEAELQGVQLDCWEPTTDERHCASLKGADLRSARMQGAVLNEAEMQGVDLSFAEMQGADLKSAQMERAIFFNAQMQGADFNGAKMQLVDLRRAQLQGAYLSHTHMQGADLFDARMQSVWLSNAQLQGASLSGAMLQGANLTRAQMQGADLSSAEMLNADCSEANFRGALLEASSVTCRNLTQAQLDDAVAFESIWLPNGLTVATCLEALPEDIVMLFRDYPGKAVIDRSSLDFLLCDKGEKPQRIGTSPSEPN